MLKEMLYRKGGDLSGGQQQQLSIARALVSEPKLLLLDEPMEGIQPSIVLDIERVIESIKDDKQMAVLLVEQSLTFATSIADYCYVLDKAPSSPREAPIRLVRSRCAGTWPYEPREDLTRGSFFYPLLIVGAIICRRLMSQSSGRGNGRWSAAPPCILDLSKQSLSRVTKLQPTPYNGLCMSLSPRSKK